MTYINMCSPQTNTNLRKLLTRRIVPCTFRSMFSQFQSYREYLKEQLLSRSKKNSSYSLRAFARDLDLAPSTLSEILKGSKNLSPEKAHQVATLMGLSTKQRDLFCLWVQSEATKDPSLKARLRERIESSSSKGRAPRAELSVDLFCAISEWYHAAICAMAHAPNFSADIKQIAKTLNIKTLEAQRALERLLRLGILTQDTVTKKIKPSEDHWVVDSPIPNEALQKFHRDMLKHAELSLQTQTPSEKVLATETFLLDEADMQEFKEITEDFIQKTLLKAKESKNRKAVYHLGVHLFRLSKKETLS